MIATTISTGARPGIILGTLDVGTLVEGRYRVLGFLGEGGFARVYKALDLEIEREVAIKVLKLRSDDGDEESPTVQRFYREARAAARIGHPSVVQIYDLGSIDGCPFIVMELLRGCDMAQALRETGPMDPTRALTLMCRCLEALGEAHRQGIVHKDLKPSNLFLTHPGTRLEFPRIVDFGIAHMKGSRSGRLTMAGQIMGTPHYLAPEYVQHQLVTPTLDVYQMGLILIEMLTGRPVVDDESVVQCALTHKKGALRVPVSLMHSPLGPVLKRALSCDHTERYPDAGEFLDALMEVEPLSVPSKNWCSPLVLLTALPDETLYETVETKPEALWEALGVGLGGTAEINALDSGGARTRLLDETQVMDEPEAELAAETVSMSPPEPPRTRVALIVALFAAVFVLGALAGAVALWALNLVSH